MRVQVTDANGRQRPEYDGVTVAIGGDAVYIFNLALNDPDGVWTISVEDTATSIATEGRVQITNFTAP